MHSKALEVCKLLQTAGGKPYLVGGCVRDELLNQTPKDYDIEVLGLVVNAVEAALAPHFEVNLVGKQFGILRVGDIDVSVPRRDSKYGMLHPDPTMTIAEAALRRDFTINTLSKDPFTGEVFDFYTGIKDIKDKVLRATSKSFGEDPLRVLRAMQFASRFDMEIERETVFMCAKLLPEFLQLPKERVWQEWKKWASKGIKLSKGLDLLTYINAYPILMALSSTPQHNKWHPEGDCYIHTCCVVNAAADIAIREGLGEEDRTVLVFAALGHDFGKVTTTKLNDKGNWCAPGHAEASVPLFTTFAESIGMDAKVLARVLPLIREHMNMWTEPTATSVRKMKHRLGPSSLYLLELLVEADLSGRPPIEKPGRNSSWSRMGETISIKPILQGRHLIGLGWKPSEKFGDVIKKVYELQLAGKVSTVEDALVYVESLK